MKISLFPFWDEQELTVTKNSVVFIYLPCQEMRKDSKVDQHFFFFILNMRNKSHFDLLFSFKGQVTFPATLTLVHNPLLASQRKLRLERFSQSDAPLEWNAVERFTSAKPAQSSHCQFFFYILKLASQHRFDSHHLKINLASAKQKIQAVLSQDQYFHFHAWRQPKLQKKKATVLNSMAMED